ncbi:hypothetical protein DFJ43DRAFT_1043659 [Lentinula guzmanii]|uniref:Uncharacterized protein n=1 Tax=Lentinula guzmanii TaxID=2804957 RepID=A0AA38JFK8_9AGAR|nr:hypothetical protein DFJ43DRAFT_1043659 [Lentinula guzmanii]
MKVLEEEAAREAEISAEKKRLEEKKMAEQKRLAEEQRKETERVARERAKALKKLAEEKKKEDEELAKRRDLAAAAALRRSGPPTSQSASGSKPKPKKVVKSSSQVRDESEELTEEEEQLAPRGVKQKIMTVMEMLPTLTMVMIPRQEMMVRIRPPPRNRDHLAIGVYCSNVKTNVAYRRVIDELRLARCVITNDNDVAGREQTLLVDRG